MRLNIIEAIARGAWKRLVEHRATYGEALAVANMLRKLVEVSVEQETLPPAQGPAPKDNDVLPCRLCGEGWICAWCEYERALAKGLYPPEPQTYRCECPQKAHTRIEGG